MRRTSFVLAGAATSLVLAACGGGGGPSKWEYIKKADAICAKANKESEQAVSGAVKNPQNPTPADAQAVIQAILPIFKKNVKDVEALERPDKDKAQLKKVFAAADGTVAAYEQAAQDPNAALALFKANGTDKDPATAANKLAADYGLKECSK